MQCRNFLHHLTATIATAPLARRSSAAEHAGLALRTT